MGRAVRASTQAGKRPLVYQIGRATEIGEHTEGVEACRVHGGHCRSIRGEIEGSGLQGRCQESWTSENEMNIAPYGTHAMAACGGRRRAFRCRSWTHEWGRTMFRARAVSRTLEMADRRRAGMMGVESKGARARARGCERSVRMKLLVIVSRGGSWRRAEARRSTRGILCLDLRLPQFCVLCPNGAMFGGLNWNH